MGSIFIYHKHIRKPQKRKRRLCDFLYLIVLFLVADGKITIEELVAALSRSDLTYGELYYQWEDVYIDLYDNILELGEVQGTYEDIDADEWIDILSDIDNYRVKPRA